ncbi:MAG: AAA family ATPase [Myxococcota bacterium]|mgnify:CR=1 FL=1
MYRREIEGSLPKTSFFLFGPRQVGKSTLLKAEPSLLTVDLLDPDERLTYTKTPKLLADQVLALGDVGTVFIDEVQRVPALLDVVQQLMAERSKMRFIMSGSSARKLRRGASNLLGGRALYRALHPLTMTEMGESFELDKVMAFGSLPAVWTRVTSGEHVLARELLKAYVTTYVVEEVQAEALVRNLQGFQNFLDVAAAQFAEQVNFLGVSRDCQVSYPTVRDYYSILEDTLLGFFLRPYVKGVRKRMSQAPRFYFFDNGVTRALLGNVQGKPSPLERGRLFEQWFVQEVVRLNEYHRKDFKLYFWRTSHGAEVDLLVEHQGKIALAIECKHKPTVDRSDLSGLASLRETFPDVGCYIVAPVKRAQKVEFAKAVGPDEMLKVMAGA